MYNICNGVQGFVHGRSSDKLNQGVSISRQAAPMMGTCSWPMNDLGCQIESLMFYWGILTVNYIRVLRALHYLLILRKLLK